MAIWAEDDDTVGGLLDEKAVLVLAALAGRLSGFTLGNDRGQEHGGYRSDVGVTPSEEIAVGGGAEREWPPAESGPEQGDAGEDKICGGGSGGP